MDFSSVIGIIVGLTSLVAGYGMDGGNVRALWLFSALVIVAGGTAGSVAMSYGMDDLKKMPENFIKIFKAHKSNLTATLDFIILLSETARRDGLLSLERILDDINPKDPMDPLLKRGILMVIDGADLEQIREHLEIDIYTFEERANNEIAIFETMAGYAPAFGMIGTIMGLIQVLANMESPEQMASAIAVAFITTLYGVIIANSICMPAANKLRLRLKESLMEKEMIVEGISSIRNGQNPKLMREKLQSYLVPGFDVPKKKGGPKKKAKGGRANEKKARK